MTDLQPSELSPGPTESFLAEIDQIKNRYEEFLEKLENDPPSAYLGDGLDIIESIYSSFDEIQDQIKAKNFEAAGKKLVEDRRIFMKYLENNLHDIEHEAAKTIEDFADDFGKIGDKIFAFIAQQEEGLDDRE